MKKLILPLLVFLGVLVAPVKPSKTQATFITVCSSGCDFLNSQLQTALNTATDGQSVLLESGHSYTSPSSGYVLGVNCAVPTWDCIIVRTGVTSTGTLMSLASFPAEGVRIDSSYRGTLAKLVPSVNNEPAIRTIFPGETGVGNCTSAPCVGNGWTLQWLEFGPKIDWAQKALVRFGSYKAGKEFQGGAWVNTMPGGDTQDKLDELPQYLSLIQCDVHGDSFVGQHQGIMLSSKDARLHGNSFTDFKSLAETQAITGLNGIGPYSILNNDINATGENIMFGGGDTFLRLKATVGGTPTTTSVQLSSPVWEELDGTTEPANLATDIYDGIYISITHAGTDYGGIKCTLSGGNTCTFPALAFTPSVGDTVKWVWLMGGLTMKYNRLLKNLEWFGPVYPALSNVGSTAGSGGSLAAAQHCYKVVAKAFVSAADPTVTSEPVETCATTGPNGKVTVTWDAESHATSYRVYGNGAAGAETQYWDIAAGTTTYVDDGTAGTAGTPPHFGSIWTVKNNFELKQGDGGSPMGAILIEGNIIDYSWCCSQSNIVSIKVNNQSKKDVSVTIRNLTFRNNWIRHANRAIALTCSTTGNDAPQAPSGPMSNVTIENNLFTDLNTTWVNTDANGDGTLDSSTNTPVLISTGSYANEVVSKGCVGVSFIHNTFLAEADNLNGPMWLNINSSSDKFVDLVVRDNIMARDCIPTSCVSAGNRTLKGFAPNNLGNNNPVNGWNGTTTGASAADHNVWPDGTITQYTNTVFPTSFFPTDADLKATHLVNYAACLADTDILGCGLQASSSMHHAASDGADVGADMTAIKPFTDIAFSGDTTGAVEDPEPGGETVITLGGTLGKTRWKVRTKK